MDQESLNDQDELQSKLIVLSQEHRDLDDAITALAKSSTPDLIQLQRLKKRKLHLRDQIEWIRSRLLPDIIA